NGMKQIIRDSSGYYLLGYTSSSAPTDGKFHTIDVKVNRPGVEVRARKGYWAYTPEEAVKARAPAKPSAPSPVLNALNSVAEPAGGDRAAEFWLGTDMSPAGQPQVLFAWNPAPPVPGAHPDVAADVELTAIAADGRPLFHGKVPGTTPTLPAPPSAGSPGTGTSPGAQGQGGSIAFNAPPGDVQLRIMVHGEHGQVIDSDAKSIIVPNYGTAPVTIATPRVYRARTPHDRLELRNNPDAPPTASRDFSRTETILIRFDAYASGGAHPAVTARLLNRGGQPMADVPVQADPGKPLLIDFPLAPLAAGEYVIELNAKTSSGSAQQLVAFKISG
ncbi:MAG TPA: hypothetical protein VGL62_09150, partial [Vicinamibacterales bacterium]